MADSNKSEQAPSVTTISSPYESPKVAEAAAELGLTDANVDEDSILAAKKQREEDLAFRAENPNAPIYRAANPDVGGESFR